ncbi:MAG: peptidoglycan bridge formation glycyltransferase FemA/FemB family protein [Erysipelotrichaceae bacterium]
MEWQVLSEDVYASFAQHSSYNHFSQSLATKHIRERLGEVVHLVGLVDQGEVVAATLLIESAGFLGKKRFYAPRGFLIDFTDAALVQTFVAKLKAYLKQHKALYLRVDPNVVYALHSNDEQVEVLPAGEQAVDTLKQLGFVHNGFTQGYEDEQPRWNYWLDLEGKTHNELFKAFRQNTRNKINAAKRYQSKVRVGTLEDLDAFYEILEHTSDRRAFHNRNKAYFRVFLEETLANNQAKLLFVDVNLKDYQTHLKNEQAKYLAKQAKMQEKGGSEGAIKEVENNLNALQRNLEETSQWIAKYGEQVISATSMFITYGNEVIYFHSGGYDDLMKLSGQYFLQDYMIEGAVQQGYPRYNFFGIQHVSAQDGVYLFKRGFSGYAVELVGQFDLIIDASTMRLYETLKTIKQKIKR